MKLKDVISIEQGLFKFINYQVETFTFTELDLLFLTQYGEREIAPVVEYMVNDGVLSDESLSKIGQLINKMFHDSWDDSAIILDFEYEPFDNYKEVIETHRKNENSNTTNIDNNTYGFNSVTEVDRDNTNQTSEGGINEDIIQTKHGLTNGNYLDIIETALKAKALKLVDVIFEDVKGFMSLDVYK